MKIEVLGAGCPKCLKLESMVKEMVSRLGLDAEVSHVYNIDEIVERGVMMTPALVVDGKVKLSGKLPSETELKNILTGLH
jgi:small redox-active disulfide protein 2